MTNRLGRCDIKLGTTEELTAVEARARALAELKRARHETDAGPRMRDYADEFLRRTAHRWKPATRATNRDAIANRIRPYFGEMRVPDIDPSDVHCWFDAMSHKPATANRTLPVLSVMMTQAELWDIRPQGSNPCSNIRRYRNRARKDYYVQGWKRGRNYADFIFTLRSDEPGRGRRIPSGIRR